MNNNTDNPDRTANSATVVFPPGADWPFIDLIKETLATSEFIEIREVVGETPETTMIIVKQDGSNA